MEEYLRLAHKWKWPCASDQSLKRSGGESIGNLPTSFNYIASCMKGGWVYIGVVLGAKSGPPVATVQVDFAATHP
jgi:hypothetical protein